MKKFYVYSLKTSENDCVFYIGKGSGKRMYRHVQIVQNNHKCRIKNPKLYNKIEHILKNGYEVIPEIIFESYDEKECLELEKNKISEYGIENLCNLTFGGEGCTRPVPEEVRLKISNKMKGRKSNFKGKKLSNESKLKMSLAHKDKKFSSEHREKISKSLNGKTKTKDHVDKIRQSNILVWRNKNNSL